MQDKASNTNKATFGEKIVFQSDLLCAKPHCIARKYEEEDL